MVEMAVKQDQRRKEQENKIEDTYLRTSGESERRAT